MEYQDIRYAVETPNAIVTIDRPKRLNAFRGRTVEELIHAFQRAWTDLEVRASNRSRRARLLRRRRPEGDVEHGSYGTSANGLFEIDTLQQVIRELPEAGDRRRRTGSAIGGGHVLHVVCDVTIAAEHARFGQAGPRVGSFDVATARRISRAWSARSAPARSGAPAASTTLWHPRRALGAREQDRPGRPAADQARAWGREVAALSPTALRFLKASFNADTAHVQGIGQLAFAGLAGFSHSAEAKEGRSAFAEKRPPDFSKRR